MNLILVIGAAGQGKTKWVSSNLGNGYKPNPFNKLKSIQVITNRSLKQYIFDINNEYEFPADNKILPQIRHIDGDVNTFLSNVKKLKNTNIVVEDATGYFRGKQSAILIRQIVNRKHTGNNFIILFHSINRIPPELMEMAELVVLFRTVDNIENIDKKFKNQILNNAFFELKRNNKIEFLKIKLI